MKKSLKKIIAIALTIVALTVGTMPIYAADQTEKNVGEYAARWRYILGTDYSFWFEDEENGQLCVGGGTNVPIAYNAYVKVELQKYSGGWVTIDSWEEVYNMGADVEEFPYLTSRGSYRIKTTHQARNKTTGAVLEEFIDYSDVLTY